MKTDDKMPSYSEIQAATNVCLQDNGADNIHALNSISKHYISCCQKMRVRPSAVSKDDFAMAKYAICRNRKQLATTRINPCHEPRLALGWIAGFSRKNDGDLAKCQRFGPISWHDHGFFRTDLDIPEKTFLRKCETKQNKT